MARKKTTKPKKPKQVEALTHDEAKRKNIPTAEYQSVMRKEDESPLRVAYERRNRDLDPQLVWRGKDQQDWSDLVVQAPPLYIQEKVHPKVLIDDLTRQTEAQHAQERAEEGVPDQTDLFADFNGLPDDVDKTDFYQHDQNWSNRMILGDSLQVMASLAEREGLRGQVQCIYIDPPYGIKFNSNFQWSTTSRDVKDGNAEHLTREPEQVKAFRDTWRDGIHSYLTYLRDRLMVARDLLAESGSIFVQIGDENVHRVRALMDEVLGEDNCIAVIAFKKSGAFDTNFLQSNFDHIVWYAKTRSAMKFRAVPEVKEIASSDLMFYDTYEERPFERCSVSNVEFSKPEELLECGELLSRNPLNSDGWIDSLGYEFKYEGKVYNVPKNRHWTTTFENMARLGRANRLIQKGQTLRFARYWRDYSTQKRNNVWMDTAGGGFVGDARTYVVQTDSKVVQRCVLMTADPGDLVLDPTCGSGTTAYVAEQWGRRWITIDTSRVALALARARIMGARYPYYLLADSMEGQLKEAELSRKAPSEAHVYGNIRQGFVYERVPHITLKSIANNAEIDVIWEKYQERLEPLREKLNDALGTKWEEWEIPRNVEAASCRLPGDKKRLEAASTLLNEWWEQRIARQKEIDASIAAKADYEFLYDKPYEDKKTVRVAGPFTVESLSPHRVLGVDEDDELIDQATESGADYGKPQDFTTMILENLRTAGVQQAHKEDKITFTSVTPWPGDYICAEGRGEVASGEWLVAGKKKTSHKSQTTKHFRAGILVGPEFGTVARADLVAAAREAGDADFDVLITCAFNYDARSSDFDKLGRVPVLKARMNADLHMAEDLKNTGKGNLFVIFGEPDVEVVSGEWLVASNGRMIAHYGSCKELSGLGSLEEINRLGRTELPRLKQLSAGGEVRAHQPGSQGGRVGTVQHRGGRGANRDGGIPAVPKRGKRVAGGSGDSTDSGGTAGLSDGSEPGGVTGTGSGNQPHARWTKTIAAIQTLTPADFPLSLTTSHYSQVTINGVDVFHPNTGEVRSDGAEGIACWFIDTDYNEESFFVRHAYFLGQNDPYKSLKTSLKAEINEDAWESLHSDTSRPFDKPESGRIAVKVINHLGDEVMKVFRV